MGQMSKRNSSPQPGCSYTEVTSAQPARKQKRKSSGQTDSSPRIKVKHSKMAVSMKQIEQTTSLEELVNCPVCYNRMESPKHLQCQHAFCQACLEKWVSQPDNPKDKICCPLCQRNTQLDGGVGKLPSDININRVLDLLGDIESSSKVSRPNCSCQQNVAVYHCQTCKEKLCWNCKDAHSKKGIFTKHKIELLERACPKHTDMPLGFFCKTCKRFVCMMCKKNEHQTHRIDAMKNIARSNRDQLSKVVKHVHMQLNQVQSQSDQYGSGAVLRSYDEVAQAVEQHTEQGIMLINKWREAMMQELNQKKSLALEKVSEYDNQYAVSESLVIYAEGKLKEADYEVVNEFISLQQSLQNTKEDLEAFLQRPALDKKAHFSPEPWRATFGSLHFGNHVPRAVSPELSKSGACVEVHQAIPASEPGPSTTRVSPLYPRLDVIESSQEATQDAIAAMEVSASESEEAEVGGSPVQATAPPIEASHLFHPLGTVYSFDILDREWQQNDIYFSKKVFPEEGFATKLAHSAAGFLSWLSGRGTCKLECPIDIAVDTKKSYLYLLNKQSKEVIRYEFPSDLQLNIPQMVMKNMAASSISVSFRDSCIAACDASRVHFLPDGYIPDLTGRTSDVYPTQKFLPYTLPTCHSIALSDANHWVFLDSAKCLVAVYRQDATLRSGYIFRHLVTFGSEGNRPGQFSRPSSVCIDSKNKQIYVSDTGNHRIQAFSFDGIFQWQSGSRGSRRGEFDRPQGICTDDVGNILVADAGNLRIAVLRWCDGKCRKVIETCIKALDEISPYRVGIYSPEHNCTAYIIMAGLRKDGRMPLVSIMKYSK